MKLYSWFPAPNPRRVLIYLAEKGITNIELVNVDLMKSEQKSAEFTAKNPMASVPVLELDDGEILTESAAIMAYFEAENPTLSGKTKMERARITELDSLILFSMLPRIARIFRNSSPIFAKRIKQFPEIAKMERESLPWVMETIESKLRGGEFVITDFPSIADCTLYAVTSFAQERAEIDPLSIGKTPQLQEWFATFSKRDSVSFGDL